MVKHTTQLSAGRQGNVCLRCEDYKAYTQLSGGVITIDCDSIMAGINNKSFCIEVKYHYTT